MALHSFDNWRVSGLQGSRNNRTKSWWYTFFCFADWIETILHSYCIKKEEKTCLIRDSLRSHLSVDVIRVRKENNINFVFLPGNTSHLTQPLGVLLIYLEELFWKSRKTALVKEACVLEDNHSLRDILRKENVIVGFEKCGIVPLNHNNMLLASENNDQHSSDLISV